MERVPAYLVWYLLRIRRHADDPGFLPARFREMPMSQVEREVAMIEELASANLILLDRKKEKVVFEPANDAVARRYGDGFFIEYPVSFALAPGGHYLLREAVAQGLLHAGWTIVAAVLGGVVALGLSQVFNL